MVRTSCVAAFFLAVAALLSFQDHSTADEPKAGETKEGQFAGKVVLVISKGLNGRGLGSLGNTALLEKVQVKQLGNTHFLVGLSRLKSAEAFDGRTVWIPLNEVVGMIEFDNIEQAQKTLSPTAPSNSD